MPGTDGAGLLFAGFICTWLPIGSEALTTRTAERDRMRMLAAILSTREMRRFDFYETRSTFTKLYGVIANE